MRQRSSLDTVLFHLLPQKSLKARKSQLYLWNHDQAFCRLILLGVPQAR